MTCFGYKWFCSAGCPALLPGLLSITLHHRFDANHASRGVARIDGCKFIPNIEFFIVRWCGGSLIVLEYLHYIRGEASKMNGESGICMLSVGRVWDVKTAFVKI